MHTMIASREYMELEVASPDTDTDTDTDTDMDTGTPQVKPNFGYDNANAGVLRATIWNS